MDLLIVGASARAAAFSALRIGLRPTCLDLFGDADLAAFAPTLRIDPADYPGAFEGLAGGLPPMPWVYTGALENHPDLVDRISARHRLLGNPGPTLRAVRDPFVVAKVLHQAGLDAPGVRPEPDGLPHDGSWLRKPRASAGGRGIVPWTARAPKPRGPVYYQERIEGLSFAAIFVGTGSSGVRSLGISRQYVGRGSHRFSYRGSLAPWVVTERVRERVESIGRVLGGHFGLVGLFGIDLVVRGETPWPIEVNPRYTASVEVLEWASGRSLLAEHVLACGIESGSWRPLAGSGLFVGKALVHADREGVWSGDDWGCPIDPTEFPTIADIPRQGTLFRPGDPIASVLARSPTPDACRRLLVSRTMTCRGSLR